MAHAIMEHSFDFINVERQIKALHFISFLTLISSKSLQLLDVIFGQSSHIIFMAGALASRHVLRV